MDRQQQRDLIWERLDDPDAVEKYRAEIVAAHIEYTALQDKIEDAKKELAEWTAKAAERQTHRKNMEDGIYELRKRFEGVG
jgi:predicted  nucleic acid-binding Zn-ribbon protein